MRGAGTVLPTKPTREYHHFQNWGTVYFLLSSPALNELMTRICGGRGVSGVIEAFNTASRDRLKTSSLNSRNVIRKAPHGATMPLLFP